MKIESKQPQSKRFALQRGRQILDGFDQFDKLMVSKFAIKRRKEIGHSKKTVAIPTIVFITALFIKCPKIQKALLFRRSLLKQHI